MGYQKGPKMELVEKVNCPQSYSLDKVTSAESGWRALEEQFGEIFTTAACSHLVCAEMEDAAFNLDQTMSLSFLPAKMHT